MSKVLLVDDEPKILRALSAALELDHDIYIAESASKAKVVIGHQGPFDAVITDEVMPGEKGHDLLTWCRKKSPKSKRIMLTGLPITQELKTQCRGLDKATIFTKPWDLSKLEHALSNTDTPDKAKLNQQALEHDNVPPTVLIFDESERNKEIYNQLEENFSPTLIFAKSAAALL